MLSSKSLVLFGPIWASPDNPILRQEIAFGCISRSFSGGAGLESGYRLAPRTLDVFLVSGVVAFQAIIILHILVSLSLSLS
jgi:hypothetical protein